jgi:SAM-dependent methyltransferase
MEEKNQDFFNNPATVAEYDEHYQSLIPPEDKILEFIRSKNVHQPIENFLDIGIGAGRTTRFFAPVVKNYTGIDYAPKMIEHCQKHLAPLFPNAKFDIADARNLKIIPSSSMDWVFFSFNGIDCVPASDRTQVYESIYRVLKPGGRMVFSTHNLLSLPDLYRWHFTLRPIGIYWEIVRNIRIRKLNPPLESLMTQNIVSVRDGVHRFQISLVYVKPEYQISELQKHGFADIQVWLPGSPSPQRPAVLRDPQTNKLSSITFTAIKPNV